uniref:Uncharacterized protein n=1 Tax=Rhizophora mucronata TaxID=61149 RepID=A0A2P2NRE2_RHIMU
MLMQANNNAFFLSQVRRSRKIFQQGFAWTKNEYLKT